MLYNVAGLLLESAGTVRHIEVDEPARRIDDDLAFSSPIQGHLRLTRTNRGIIADAALGSEIHLECSRCLEDAVEPIEVSFIEEFYPTVDLHTGLALKMPEGGSGFMLTEAHELDLMEPLRQYTLLALPMKPLCRPDCAGLCPNCGKDLNQGPCGCVAEPVDPRLADLVKWLGSDRSN